MRLHRKKARAQGCRMKSLVVWLPAISCDNSASCIHADYNLESACVRRCAFIWSGRWAALMVNMKVEGWWDTGFLPTVLWMKLFETS
jgi:hypothetical protein